jgi:hypothetical protein
MNEAAAKRLRSAEEAMNRALTVLLQQAGDNGVAIAKLRKAQATWETYRDAQIDVLWPFPEHGQYGSVHPMCVADAKPPLPTHEPASCKR